MWNEEALEASKEIILCESLIDALTFWCAGFRNVTASYGVNGFTDDHRAAFKKYGTKRVLIAYDRDEAGEKAAAALAPRTDGDGHRMFPGAVPRRSMDANEYALNVTPAAKTLGRAAEHGAMARQGQTAGAGDGRDHHRRRHAGASHETRTSS